ncbi:hypothetical protein P170DRAFT_508976 [Aspergillus steynii IBT 23096]|uniref:Uncharacterized protein n=1 Tax=Aspergillus steynii IBT 23096 TaxID=1392250 RepID=A0A2I2GDD9_9EURO|nr:uncharacterized protein P170DRAFT_508976 [Aspergillus steynii IBT 23096]PLB50892.1 hypothetical protein P170DRAFT_508976 [Aspergillus steynii IBT 23096]
MSPRHHHSNKCSSTVRIPPVKLWTTTDVAAFPNDHTNLSSISKCCGETTKITLYNKSCAKFCNTSGNTTEVVDCLHDAGLSKATSYHNDDGGKSAASSLSKPAMGLIMMVVGSLVAGTL